MTPKIISLTFAGSLLATVPGFAAVIWTNPITGTNPNTANPYTTGDVKDANITVSGIGRGPGIDSESGNDQYNADHWSLAGFDATDYFTFTLDAANGYEIDFNSFVYTGQRSSQGPTLFAVRSSVDGFTSNIGTPTATGATISLAGAAYQDVTAPIEFRLYGFTASNVNGDFAVNDFTFDGTVGAVVPEPSSSAIVLGAIGFLGLVRRRR